MSENERTAEYEERARASWLAYRNERARLNPWCDQQRLARQMRKRDFIAGYLAAVNSPMSKEA